MDITTPPPERPKVVIGPIGSSVKRYSAPPSVCHGLVTPPLHPVHENPKTSAFSKSSWVAVNARPNTESRDGYYDDDDGYDMDIDEDNLSADEDEYPNEDFEEDLQYYAHHGYEISSKEPAQEEEEETEQPTELDGKPHHILKIYGSHDHIILTASKTSPLLTPEERDLMTQIKSRKDEATLGFPSGSHSYHPYLGPSILRNASQERLGQFLNGPDLEKIKIDLMKYPNRKGLRRIKARTLWEMLYVRAIREKETEFILKETEKQEKEREEGKVNGEKIVGTKGSLFAAYNVHIVEEEEMSWDEMLKLELERKTEGLTPGERRDWLRNVYGARWTWCAMKFGLHAELEEGDVVVRS